MANTEDKNENVIPVTNDLSFVVKEEVCSEADSPPVSPVHKTINNVHENSEINPSTETDLNEEKSKTSPEETDINDDPGSLKIDEENTHATSDDNDDKPVDYSQKSSKTASKSKKDSAKNDKPMQLFMNGFNLGLQGIQFSGGILYQPTDQSRLISPFVQHHADGKQMRPFKAYNAKRDILTGMPLAGYAVPIGGKVNEASAIPFRINNKNKSLSQVPTNGTQAASPSTHLMTLATEADKLRQLENGLVKNQNENTPSEDGLNSDGNDSYKEDINEFYPQGLQDAEKKKGKKRKNSMEDQMKDDTYWERRRKNNEAAKRSRDARRAKEDQIAIRAALLEQENMRLRIELAALKEEMIKLRSTVYGKSGKPS